MSAGKRIGTFLIFTAAVIAILAPLLQATYPKCEIGILTRAILDGNNPATGEWWADGDTYRLVFYTSGKMTAESSDISVYNAFIQGLADATTLYDIGADEGVTWKVIGSTSEVDARDNTSTNPVDGNDLIGGPIFLLDGSTLVADDNADLWDGEIHNVINITENGSAPDYYWPCTGTYWDGTKTTGHASSYSVLGGSGEIQQGNAEVTTDWVWRMWAGGTTKVRPLYAMSGPLTIIGDANLPSVDINTEDMIAWSGVPVELDATVVNNDTTIPKGELIYEWSADDVSSADPNLTIVVTYSDDDPADATVTITKDTYTSGATVVEMGLYVTLPGKRYVRKRMTIDVYDTACDASIELGMAEFDAGDFNKDCTTNLVDFALMTAHWLEDRTITEAKPKDLFAADFDGNYKIDLRDFAIIAKTWGDGTGISDLVQLAETWLEGF